MALFRAERGPQAYRASRPSRHPRPNSASRPARRPPGVDAPAFPLRRALRCTRKPRDWQQHYLADPDSRSAQRSVAPTRREARRADRARSPLSNRRAAQSRTGEAPGPPPSDHGPSAPSSQKPTNKVLYAAAHQYITHVLLPLRPRQRFRQCLIGLLVRPIVPQRSHDNAAGPQGVDVALRSLLARPTAEADPVIGQTARIGPRLYVHSLEQSDTLPRQGERARVSRREVREVNAEASRITPADR